MVPPGLPLLAGSSPLPRALLERTKSAFTLRTHTQMACSVVHCNRQEILPQPWEAARPWHCRLDPPKHPRVDGPESLASCRRPYPKASRTALGKLKHVFPPAGLPAADAPAPGTALHHPGPLMRGRFPGGPAPIPGFHPTRKSSWFVLWLYIYAYISRGHSQGCCGLWSSSPAVLRPPGLPPVEGHTRDPTQGSYMPAPPHPSSRPRPPSALCPLAATLPATQAQQTLLHHPAVAWS